MKIFAKKKYSRRGLRVKKEEKLSSDEMTINGFFFNVHKKIASHLATKYGDAF